MKFDTFFLINFTPLTAIFDEWKLLQIGRVEKLFVQFDGHHRTWYTREASAYSGSDLPTDMSAVYSDAQLMVRHVTTAGHGFNCF